jgi:hypothetical protein
MPRRIALLTAIAIALPGIAHSKLGGGVIQPPVGNCPVGSCASSPPAPLKRLGDRRLTPTIPIPPPLLSRR